jgi:hypothetical protein
MPKYVTFKNIKQDNILAYILRNYPRRYYEVLIKRRLRNTLSIAYLRT